MSQERRPVARITAIAPSSVGRGPLDAALRAKGILAYNLTSGKGVLLKERTGVLGKLLPGRSLFGVPADILTVLVDPRHEAAALRSAAEALSIGTPGKGSVYSEDLTVCGADETIALNQPSGGAGGAILAGLSGICTIVQRGEGDGLAQSALESGVGGPVVFFGEGTGLRDKLGLLRITIPAEKELVALVTSAEDADPIMDMLIDAGRLDLPGKGFIYTYPVKQGIIDPRVSAGTTSHAATMDQVILALDELKGGSAWRRHDLEGASGRKARTFLTGLVDLTIVCDEGRAGDLVAAAMAAGAAGATISKSRLVAPESATKASPARERCSLIVGEKQLDTIIAAIEKAGLGDDATHGQILLRPVPKACTYLGGGAKKS